jgi:hypothetical protein
VAVLFRANFKTDSAIFTRKKGICMKLEHLLKIFCTDPSDICLKNRKLHSNNKINSNLPNSKKLVSLTTDSELYQKTPIVRKKQWET